MALIAIASIQDFKGNQVFRLYDNKYCHYRDVGEYELTEDMKNKGIIVENLHITVGSLQYKENGHKYPKILADESLKRAEVLAKEALTIVKVSTQGRNKAVYHLSNYIGNIVQMTLKEIVDNNVKLTNARWQRLNGDVLIRGAGTELRNIY